MTKAGVATPWLGRTLPEERDQLRGSPAMNPDRYPSCRPLAQGVKTTRFSSPKLKRSGRRLIEVDLGIGLVGSQPEAVIPWPDSGTLRKKLPLATAPVGLFG